MIKIYDQSEANPKALAGLRIAVLGYGSQGRGQSLNLRDSGCNVVLGLRRNGRTRAQAIEDGWRPLEPIPAVEDADIIAMLAPAMAKPTLSKNTPAPTLDPDS